MKAMPMATVNGTIAFTDDGVAYPKKVLPMPRPWSDEDHDFLVAVWGNWSFERLALKFGRSPDAVRMRGHRIGLPSLGRGYEFPDSMKEADVKKAISNKKDYYL